MPTYDLSFTVRVNACRSGSDADDALEELIAELELVPGVKEVELLDLGDCYEVSENG